MPTYSLLRASEPMVADVAMDAITTAALLPFDLAPDLLSSFYPFNVPAEIPLDFGIGLIVGASGSGKSVLLREFGDAVPPMWMPRRTIVSHFDTADDAAERLYAVGLNTIPAWRLPYAALSNGQKFRADLARTIGDGAVVDEFTSVVDRNVATSASRSLAAWVARTHARRLVLASCHRDVIPWLSPEWVIDTDAGTLTVGDASIRPVWYVQHIIGEKVGRLVLA